MIRNARQQKHTFKFQHKFTKQYDAGQDEKLIDRLELLIVAWNKIPLVNLQTDNFYQIEKQPIILYFVKRIIRLTVRNALIKHQACSTVRGFASSYLPASYSAEV